MGLWTGVGGGHTEEGRGPAWGWCGTEHTGWPGLDKRAGDGKSQPRAPAEGKALVGDKGGAARRMLEREGETSGEGCPALMSSGHKVHRRPPLGPQMSTSLGFPSQRKCVFLILIDCQIAPQNVTEILIFTVNVRST